MPTRRHFLQSVSFASIGLISLRLATSPARSALPALTPFVDPLPVPAILKPTLTRYTEPSQPDRGAGPLYELPVTEISHQFHRDLPPATLWGYAGSYPGPTIMTESGKPVFVRYANMLPDAPHPLWSDAFDVMHGPNMSDPPSAQRLVAHLHGARVAHDSDGWPEDTILPGQQTNKPFWYPNIQEAATLWYHDHALGITRLNVLMGLAGFYLIRDQHEQRLPLPSGPFDIPLVIQDRTIGINAQGTEAFLSYPSSMEPEFFGETMVVNGKIAPYHQVAKGKYRLRLLNGCNSRFLILALNNNATFWQIASEQGLLPSPVAMNTITLAPGERAEIVVDFSGYPQGQSLKLTNAGAPDPYPGDGPLATPEEILEFRVGSGRGHTMPLPVTQRRAVSGFVNRWRNWSASEVLMPDQKTKVREFRLEEAVPIGSDGFEHPDVDGDMLNDADFIAVIHDPVGDTILWDDCAAKVQFGDVEVWKFVNNTIDAHPMHLHLVQFQVLDRSGHPAPSAEGPGIWKDTVIVEPGNTVTVIARFDGFHGKFPFHCHILEHEDHEMMRFFEVVEAVV